MEGEVSGRWGGKHDLTFEEYHSVPQGWQPPAVIETHRALGGTFDVASSPRAAIDSRGRSDYRALWYNIADGIRAGDAACAEIAIRFIEEHLIVSYSGFARARLARALKGAKLSAPQKKRLSAHFLLLLEKGDKCEEFSEYLRLWPGVIDEADRERARAAFAKLGYAQTPFGQKLEAALSPRSAAGGRQ
jgi:hypothetical protein